MIPQFGTLVLIRNIFGTQKWKTLFTACNFTGKHDICSNSKIVGKLFVSGLTWSTSSKHCWPTKIYGIYGFEMPAGQKKSLDFFLKNTREDVFILSAHMTSPICKWMLNMEKIQGKHRVLHHMKIGKISSNFVKNSWKMVHCWFEFPFLKWSCEHFARNFDNKIQKHSSHEGCVTSIKCLVPWNLKFTELYSQSNDKVPSVKSNFRARFLYFIASNRGKVGSVEIWKYLRAESCLIFIFRHISSEAWGCIFLFWQI